MKCKFSLNNKYRIITPCDIRKFNYQIQKFKDKSFSKLEISEQISIPDNLPNVKDLIETYIHIDIYSAKIVDTPSSDIESVEGLKLTGKILLIYGNLNQTIIYSKDKNCKSKYALKFTIPFSKYIVTNSLDDRYKDLYYIYPYIENMSLVPFDERTLNENITLFLFAHKLTEKPILPIEKLPNVFIFNNSTNNQEIARVEFDKTNKKLIVTSTGIVYGNENIPVFSFVLRNSSQSEVKGVGNIFGNQNADKFKNDLNDVSFEYNDLIKVTFKSDERVKLTNYPSLNDIYNMDGLKRQGFKITQNGIIPYVLPNEIILKDNMEKAVINVRFDILNKGMLVSSSGNVANPSGGANYFKMGLYENPNTLNTISIIAGNETGERFKSDFSKVFFTYGDIIKLEYEEANKVVITNFPDLRTPIYNPKGNQEWFEISTNGLIPFTTPIPPPSLDKKLPNSFVFNSYNKDEVIATVEFDITAMKLNITSTGLTYNKSSISVFNFELLDGSSSDIKASSEIRGNQDASKFKEDLDNTNFKFNDVVKLTCENPKKLILTNYPNKGDNYNMEDASIHGFKITQTGIVPYILSNKIILDDLDNNPVVTISFGVIGKRIIVNSTGKITDPKGGDDYFKFGLYYFDEATKILIEKKSPVIISGNQNGNKFASELTDTEFNFKDVIKLNYEDRSKVKITNLLDPKYYVSSTIEEILQITEDGLIRFILPIIPPTTGKLPNEIIINTTKGEEMVRISFDTVNKKLIAISTSVKDDSLEMNFSLCYIEFGDFDIDLFFNTDPTTFAESLNNRPFNFSDKIFISFYSPINLNVTNYPNKGEIFKPKPSDVFIVIRIEATGLVLKEKGTF